MKIIEKNKQNIFNYYLHHVKKKSFYQTKLIIEINKQMNFTKKISNKFNENIFFLQYII